MTSSLASAAPEWQDSQDPYAFANVAGSMKDPQDGLPANYLKRLWSASLGGTEQQQAEAQLKGQCEM